jgi:hypothetical protein
MPAQTLFQIKLVMENPLARILKRLLSLRNKWCVDRTQRHARCPNCCLGRSHWRSERSGFAGRRAATHLTWTAPISQRSWTQIPPRFTSQPDGSHRAAGWSNRRYKRYCRRSYRGCTNRGDCDCWLYWPTRWASSRHNI